MSVLGAAANSAMDTNSGDGIIMRKSTRQWAKECNYDPQKLFNKFFYEDILYLLSLHDLWKKRKPPKPMKFNELPDGNYSTSRSNAFAYFAN